MRAFGGQRAVEGLLSCLLAAIIVLHSSAPALAAPPADPYGVAVIVGNRNYTHEDRRGRTLPAVEFAHRDAAAFKRYVIDVLGYAPENVIELSDATKAEMEAAFGNANNYQGRLWQFIHPKRGADVVVFYSGHGVPGLKDKRGYLLPSNADPNNPEINGYPLDLLYENLGKLKAAKLVRVYLDACFSGDSDQGMLLSSASPSYVSVPLPESVGDRFSVLTAASGEEVASWDERAGHGLFTHHLLDALYGKGDEDGDGKVTAREAKAWLDDHMTYAAQRRFGRVQNATLSGEAGLVLAHAGAGGAFPERRMLEAVSGAETGAAARGKKDRAGQDKTEAPAKAPSEILLPDGLRLSDWALLAEDRLARRDYRALLVEGTGHLRAHGVHASVKSIVDRAFAGLVEGLSVTDEASAREALGSVKRLRGVVGDRVELSALGAQAHERLGQREGAAVAYRSWLELAPADHPQRKDILLALQRAERGEAAAVPAKPVAGPADVESGLGLTRGDRRSIQSGLASLGFAAGPADGLFGKRTREAISSWQEAKGEEPTGYLTRTEAEALKAAGEEARRAAAERERKTHAAAEAKRRDVDTC